MNRRSFLKTLATTAMTISSAQAAPHSAPHRFTLRGVYFHDGFAFDPHSHAPLYWQLDDWRRQIRWLRACGINAIEFATMLEFNRRPSTDIERQKIADRLRILDEAHRTDMRFGYLLTNTVLSTVPPNEAPSHQLLNRAETLCPRQPGNFEKTLDNPLFYMETYRHADFFEEFAADWGGCECGQCGVPEYLRYVQALAERLQALNPKAALYANTWSIAFWHKEPMAAGWRGVFDQEIVGSREVIAALAGLPANVGIGLPCHHLYRPLAFESYGGRAKTPAFPTADDVASVHRAGRKLLAWPHFVMDDDAYRPASWGLVHSEVRYIRALLQNLRAARFDAVMGNLYLPFLQISNTYAFGRLMDDPDLRSETILADFARLVVDARDVNALTDILAWLENNSYWQQQMPADGRLANLNVHMDRAKAAQVAASLRAQDKPAMPLPLSAETWLADLRRSIDHMPWADTHA